MSLNWNAVANLVGPAGFSVLSGSGAPASTLGKAGDIYVDTANAQLYPAKTAAGWSSSYRSLVGPVTQQVLPNDLTANSLTLSPVSGDAQATALTLSNNNNVFFNVANNGNVLANVASVAQLVSSGTAAGTAFIASSGALAKPSFTFNSQIDTGLYLPTGSATAAVMALVVNAATALSLTANGISVPGQLTVSGTTSLGAVTTGALTAASLINTGSGTAKGFFSSAAGTSTAPAFAFTAQTDSGLYLANTSASAAVLGIAVNGAQALALTNSGVSVPGTLAVTGASTLAALTAQAASVASLTASGSGSFGGTLTVPTVTLAGSGAAITFADGTTQTTAAKTYTPGTSAVFAASSNGSATAPAFTYVNQTDTGSYLATQSATGAVLGLSVNGVQSLALTKAGVQVPGTLAVTGATTLAGLGAGSVTASGTLTVSGAANLGATTLSSGNVTGGLQVQGNTTLAAASVASLVSSGAATASALTISASSGKLTFGDGTTQTTAAVSANPGSSATFAATSNGTASAPAFTYTSQADTGVYLAAASATAAVLALTVNGAQALSVNKAGIAVPGVLGVTGNTTLSGALTVSGASTLGAVTVASLTNTGLGVAAGLQSSIAGTASAPSVSYTAQTDTGQYLATTSASAAVLAFAVNATQALALSKTGVSVPGTLNVTGTTTVGTISAANVVTANLTNTGSGTAAGLFSSIAGTAAAPSFSYTNQSDTGLYLATQSASAAVLGLTVNGTQVLALAKGGVTVPGTLNVTGASTVATLTATTLTVTGNSTVQALSAGAVTAASLNTTGGVGVGGVLQVTGNATVGGTEVVTGLLTASGNLSAPIVTTTAAPSSKQVSSTNYTVSNVSLPGNFGDGNSYPPSGISADNLGNLALNYMGAPVIRMANPGYSSSTGNSPGTAFPTNFLSGAYNFNIGGTPQLSISTAAVKFGFTSNTLPVTMQAFSGNILQLQNGGSSPSFTTTTVGTVDTSGNATFAGVVKAASVTFGDGSSQTSAFTPTAASNQQRYYANANGTTALPSLTFSANTDTGAYLKTASATAAVLGLSVNATDALTATSAGVTVPGTLSVTGATTLSAALNAAAVSASALTVSGTTTAGVINSSALTASGAVKGAALTITQSGGALTFGDGTTQTTAAGAVSAGSAAKFTATSNGTVSLPAFTFTNNTDTGWYLPTSSTTAAQVSLSINATDVLYTTKTAMTIVPAITTSSSLTVNGTLNANTLNANTTFAGVTTVSTLKTNQGSASAPAIFGTNSTNTGFHFLNGPVSLNAGVSGTLVTQTQAGLFQVTGQISASSSVAASNFVAASTTFNSGTNPTYGSSSAGGYGLYINTTAATPVVGLSVAANGFLEASATLATFGIAVKHSTTTTLTGATTAAATITSTTAAGTPSFVSSQGFKAPYYMGGFVNQNPTSGSNFYFDIPGTTNGVGFQTPFAGSIVGYSIDLQAATTAFGSGTKWQVTINGTATTLVTAALAQGKQLNGSFAKGTIAVPANGYVQMVAVSDVNAAGITLTGYLWMELGA